MFLTRDAEDEARWNVSEGYLIQTEDTQRSTARWSRILDVSSASGTSFKAHRSDDRITLSIYQLSPKDGIYEPVDKSDELKDWLAQNFTSDDCVAVHYYPGRSVLCFIRVKIADIHASML